MRRHGTVGGHRLLDFLRLTRTRLRLAGFTRGDHGAVIRFFACGDHNRLVIDFLPAHAGQRRLNGVLILAGRLSSRFLMTFKARGFLSFETGLACFKARFGFGGAFFFFSDGANFRFFLTEILHQRNIARADIGAGAAFDAVSQIVSSGFIVLLADAEPVKLLRQQIGRAGVSAGAATDAVLLFLRRAHLGCRGSQQAVGDFHDRHVKAGQGKAHQRPAHDHQLFAGRDKSGVLQQVAHRRADTRPDVARTAHGFACKRHHALGQRLAVNDGALDGKGGADVLHQYADVRGTTAVRHLFTGQDLGKLFRAARRVFGRDHAQADFMLAMQYGAHHRDSLRFVVFNADQHFARLENVRQDAHAVDNLRGAILHQAVIGGDIGLALRGVDNQRLDFIAAAL